MKYTILVNQKVLADTRLDLKDAAILDYLYFLGNSRDAKIEKKRIKDYTGNWTWVDYAHMIESMPLLRVKSKGTITPRIQRIEKEKYIETRLEENQKLYFRVTTKIDELFTTEKEETSKKKQGKPSKYAEKLAKKLSMNR